MNTLSGFDKSQVSRSSVRFPIFTYPTSRAFLRSWESRICCCRRHGRCHSFFNRKLQTQKPPPLAGPIYDMNFVISPRLIPFVIPRLTSHRTGHHASDNPHEKHHGVTTHISKLVRARSCKISPWMARHAAICPDEVRQAISCQTCADPQPADKICPPCALS